MKCDQTYNMKKPHIAWSSVPMCPDNCYQVFGATGSFLTKASTAKHAKPSNSVLGKTLLGFRCCTPMAPRHRFWRLFFVFTTDLGFAPKRSTNCGQSFGQRFVGDSGGSIVFMEKIFACRTVGMIQLLIHKNWLVDGYSEIINTCSKYDKYGWLLECLWCNPLWSTSLLGRDGLNEHFQGCRGLNASSSTGRFRM